MEEHEHYSTASQLIVAWLTGELSDSEQQELDTWVEASGDHLRMMKEFSSICWHARETQQFEEPDKRAYWARIQERVARMPDAPPLPDLEQPEWEVSRRAPVLRALRIILLRWGGD